MKGVLRKCVRNIQKMGEFQLLKPHSRIDRLIINQTDHVLNVAEGLINLQTPLIGNKKIKILQVLIFEI